MFHRPRADQPSSESTVNETTTSPTPDTQIPVGATPTASQPRKDSAMTENNSTETTTTTETTSSGTGFQRPQAPQTPVRPASFGAPSYSNFSANATSGSTTPASGATSYQPTTASQPNPGGFASAYGQQQQGRRLVIGEGITMSGEIESCENLVVEGTVDASLRGARNLEITQTGTYYGSVEIDEATIAGRFEGDLKVSGRLTIRASGSIIGSISYKELAIEPGAVIDGRISPLTAIVSTQDSKRGASAGKGRVAAANISKPGEKESEGLFAGRRAGSAE